MAYTTFNAKNHALYSSFALTHVDIDYVATIAQSLPSITQGVAGKLTYKGTAANALSAITQGGAGKLIYQGTAGQSLPSVVQSGSGAISAPGFKSIGTNGRDYSTITLWEADLDDEDVYDAGMDVVGEMYNDSVFDEAVTIDGGGTLGLNSVTLTVAAGERHDGTAGSGARVVYSSDIDGSILYGNPPGFDFRFGWIEVTRSTTGYGRGITIDQGASSGVTGADHCLVHGLETSTSDNFYSGIVIPNSSWNEGRVHNNIVYAIENSKSNSSGSGSAVFSGAGAAGSICYNNTIHGCAISGASATGNINGLSDNNSANESIKNNVVTDTANAGAGTAVDVDVNVNPTYSNNATSDASGDVTSISSGDQYVSSEDLHLKSGADCIDAGTDLGTTPAGVEIDIDGNDRDAGAVTWSIGAHEFNL